VTPTMAWALTVSVLASIAGIVVLSIYDKDVTLLAVILPTLVGMFALDRTVRVQSSVRQIEAQTNGNTSRIIDQNERLTQQLGLNTPETEESP
jgi:TctA family transporter